MKKDTLLFIAASIILGIILIISLNKMKAKTDNLGQESSIKDLQNLDESDTENLTNIIENQEQDYSMPATLSANQSLTKPEMEIDVEQTYRVTLNTTQGSIVIELDSKNTPITSNNFVYLAEKGFYNNTIFHRVIDGFMIQGGDPRGDGTGGPGYTFADEDIVGEYQRGTVAMANSGANTNGSQFFIMHQDNPLPKNYVIFGQVIEGMEVVDSIATAPVAMSLSGEKSRPIQPVMVKSAIVSKN